MTWNWVRRLLGESTTLVAVRADTARLSAELDEARAEITRLRLARVAAANTDRGLRALIDVLIEPAAVEGCRKVRLPDTPAAAAFAVRLAADLGDPAGTFEPYACPLCPRQPLTGARYRHVRHVDPARRGLRSGWRRPRPGIAATHLDPAAVARLRASADPAPS